MCGAKCVLKTIIPGLHGTFSTYEAVGSTVTVCGLVHAVELQLRTGLQLVTTSG